MVFNVYMMKFGRIFQGLFLSVFIGSGTAGAQDYIQPVADYSFDDSMVVDNSGNTELKLRNRPSLIDDPSRGTVLRFSSSQKSYAVLNKQLLHTDSCTISFFFYWEAAGATSWHQIFEIHNEGTGSNLYFTPQNGWGANQCSLISDCKEFGNYENVDARPLVKNAWMHIAVTFNGKMVTIYINGEKASGGYIMFTPDLIHGDSLYFGGNPYRSDNYYITARLDDIRIYDVALSANQVQALYKGTPVPEPEGSNTVWETTGSPMEITIDLNAKKQTIRNFGSSDAWNTDQIGRYWPFEKKNELARMLFSTGTDTNGNPMGIGLSAWRFNIGAGTTEQGNASRISNVSRRTEGFLNTDSITYNWDKQAGQQWFLKEAAATYHVPCLIGFVNSPPVLFTKKNLGFRDYGLPMSTILKPEHFSDYARFLADVVEHFESEGVHFNYISPLNEPQWGWSPSASGGTVDQEGSPWTNQEIHDVASSVCNEFSKRKINSRLFITEAGSIANLLRGTGHADKQLASFWDASSPLSLVGTESFSNIVSYHSYWSDYGTLLVDDRSSLSESARLLNPAPELWQTEYSLLGSGYREGYPANQKLSEMDCALSLARIISADLNIAGTSAWQWWTTFEKGKHGGESRFALFEAYTNIANNNGEYHPTKLLYALGNFSRFIRPGMIRVETTRSDALSLKDTYNDVVFSAYTNDTANQLVLLAVNFTYEAREITLSFANDAVKTTKNPTLYLTDTFSNLTKQNIDLSSQKLIVPARSVITYTAGLENNPVGLPHIEISEFKVYLNQDYDEIHAIFNSGGIFQQIILYTVSGSLIQVKDVRQGQNCVVFPVSDLPAGVYLVSGRGGLSSETKKIVITQR